MIVSCPVCRTRYRSRRRRPARTVRPHRPLRPLRSYLASGSIAGAARRWGRSQDRRPDRTGARSPAAPGNHAGGPAATAGSSRTASASEPLGCAPLARHSRPARPRGSGRGRRRPRCGCGAVAAGGAALCSGRFRGRAAVDRAQNREARSRRAPRTAWSSRAISPITEKRRRICQGCGWHCATPPKRKCSSRSSIPRNLGCPRRGRPFQDSVRPSRRRGKGRRRYVRQALGTGKCSLR